MTSNLIVMNTLNEINWFPGHMKKALDNIKERLKSCDGVIEIGDSRAPISSFPDYLDKLVADKAKFFLFSKADLADKAALEKHLERYAAKGINALALNLTDKKAVQILIQQLSAVKTKQEERFLKLGFPSPSKRFLVLGIPNVGKSTLINSLAKKKKAAVENKPGKTRSESLIKISDKIYIVDAPGILEPNYQNKNVIIKLALLGSIRNDILPLIPLTDYLLEYLIKHYPERIIERYHITLSENFEEMYLQIAKERNFLVKNTLDSQRARTTLLTEFRAGLLGGISLDE